MRSALREFFTHTACWLLILPLVPCVSVADEAVSEKKTAELETIIVSGTRAQAIAGKASVIDAPTVEAVHATHPSELLTRQPGVWISRGGGQEQLTALRSPVWTGAGACGEVVFAEDGVPVRPSGFCNANAFMEINTEQSGGVEVLRGAQGGSLYGANAVHGVINVLSEPFASASRITGEVGANDYARLMWQQSDNDSGVALNATHDGGYQDSSGFEQQKMSWKQRQQFSGADSGIALTHFFTATSLNQQSIGYLVGQDAYKNDAIRADNPNPDAYRDAVAYRYVQDWAWQANDWQVHVKPYLRHTDMQFSQHFNPGQPLENNGHNSGGMQWLLQRDNFSWGTWQWGAETDIAHAWTHEWQDLPTTAGPPAKVSPQGDHYDYGVNMQTAALWQALSWQLAERVEWQFGLRADRVWYQYDNNMPDGASGKYMRPADRGDRFALLSPRIGLVYTDARDNEWYASVSSGSRAPQTAELYRLQGNQRMADIGAESMTGEEIGWRGSNRWQLQWNVALFTMHKDHVIIRNAASVLSDSASTQHRGLELQLEKKWQDGWFANVAATYAEHRYDSPVFDNAVNVEGNLMDTAPRTFGSLQAGWQQNGLRLEIEWQHMARYYLNPEDSFQYDGHNLFNLRGEIQPGQHWKIFSRVMNVTNVDYAERADVTTNPNPALVVPRYFVGMPRSLYVGFEWSY
ncbi:MAG TPA: TonB-dependent receptor [Pseudomonadales bacterium]|nr:TonB-dependent receptor [Pseudomonadales bacterium]